MKICKLHHRKWFKAGIALSATMSAQTANAQNSFYQGECSRAYEVQANNSLDKLFKYSSYKGVSMHRFTEQSNSTCKSDRVIIRYLTRNSLSKDAVSFNLVRKEVTVGSKPDRCSELSIWNETVIGTVKITMEVASDKDLCTVNVWADWQLTDPADPNWRGSFKNALLMLNDGSFVVAQRGPQSGLHDTPLAFTGVQ